MEDNESCEEITAIDLEVGDKVLYQGGELNYVSTQQHMVDNGVGNTSLLVNFEEVTIPLGTHEKLVLLEREGKI